MTRQTDRITQLPLWNTLLGAFESKKPIHGHKLVGSSKAFLAAAIWEHTRRPVLYVAPDEERADAALLDLRYLTLGDAGANLLHLPHHQVPPYDLKTPHSETAAARLETLTHLAREKDGIVVTTMRGLMEQVPSPGRVRDAVVHVKTGQDINVDDVLSRLTYMGYSRCQAVEEVGDYALRGGILDIYSLGGTHPIRIEVDYEAVSSIREFDIHTQRSVRALEEAAIVPRHELFLDQDRMDAAVKTLTLESTEAGRELEEAFETEVHPVGIERFAAALGQDLGSVLRFLPDNTVVIEEEPGLGTAKAQEFWEAIQTEHAKVSETFPYISDPEDLFVSPESLDAAMVSFARLSLSDLSSSHRDWPLLTIRTRPPQSFGRNIEMWRQYLLELCQFDFELVMVCDNEGQKKRLQELLVDEGIPIRLDIGVLAQGFVWEDLGKAVLTDHEFFGRPRRRARAKRFRSGFGLRELRTLKHGSYVVHVEHGIGVYKGLNRLEVNGQLTDVLELHYAAGDKLYVPIDQLDLVQRYSSEEGRTPSISRLGGTGWAKTKSKARKAIEEMAGELLRNYARRKAHPGHKFGEDTVWQRELEGSFPFDETPDQLTAMEAVKNDMESESPMDRLICGDVGYGKTEVAVRAAFKAVMEGKQVAVLVPTTILCEQHYLTFKDRFEDFPVNIDMVSRFRTTKQRNQSIGKIADGSVDIAIGTHALLGKKVKFKKLGLVVIDEEQRFGVAHKEQLRSMKTGVDILTLTATPIPRTMNMSLLGARDITVIQTPPQGRMPVQTEISDFDRELIQEALLREADRGGQSFFVHNRVESIQTMGTYLRKLVPQLTVAVAHGQMNSRQLEDVMMAFIRKEYDVLLATMIIENGLDIPSVNTMIVNRADRFGLAQLYQLRGRVGRSTQKAYCYFLVPGSRSLTETAMKRLRAIAEFDELGSGFALAMRDLEIRGAGNILGRDQHGHLVSVGFEMYCRLLDEAVRDLKGLPLEDRPEPRLSTDVDAFLPEDYVEQADEKVAFYKRLADAKELSHVEALESELRDRFGRLREVAQALFHLRRVRILGSVVGVIQVTIRKERVDIELAAPPNPAELRTWMQQISVSVEFQATGRFAIKAEGDLTTALIILAGMAGVSGSFDVLDRDGEEWDGPTP